MIKKIVFIFSLFYFMTLNFSYADSSAGLVIEPYLGWSLLGNIRNSSASLGSFNGFAFGSQVKVKFMQILFAGIDCNVLPYVAVSNTSLPNGPTFGGVRLGPIAGVTLPLFPMSFWLGYNFLDTSVLTMNNFTTGTGTYSPGGTVGTYYGSSFKLGLGYRVIDYFAVRAEYTFSTYGSSSNAVSSVGIPGTNLYSNFLFLSASVPIDINW